jgi:tRNA (mo5U34)-methyltransferase
LAVNTELARRIESFPAWQYEFELGGVRTRPQHPQGGNRQRERKRYFFDPLVDLCGGSLAGKRVLDLGCNAGYWMLAALEADCEFVAGIDGRRMHIEQASLVMESKRIDPRRYRLTEGDVFRTELGGPYDIVLCLGLLYHVSRHVELLERIAAVNTDLLVIDSTLVGVPGSFVHWKRENIESPRAAIADTLVGYPTKKALVAWTSALGYQTRILQPHFDDWAGCSDYRWGMRRAFFCSQETPLERVGAEDANSLVSQLLDPARYAAFKLGKKRRGGEV